MKRALRLLVTRATDDATSWSRELERRGHAPVELACVEIELLRAPANLAQSLESADWIVFTSARGVAAAAAAGAFTTRTHACFAAVGPGTAARVREHAGRCELVAEPANGAELARALVARLAAEFDATSSAACDARPAAGSDATRARATSSRAGARVVALGAESPEERFDAACARAGLLVERIALYRTIPAAARAPRADLAAWRLDAALLASPSAALGLAAQADVPRELALACIGPTTAAAARAIARGRVLEAREPTLDGLLECLNEIERP